MNVDPEEPVLPISAPGSYARDVATSIGRWSTLGIPEDTAALRQGVLDLLRDLNRERALTMIMVTHDIQIAQQADRVVRLAEGRIEEWAPALA